MDIQNYNKIGNENYSVLISFKPFEIQLKIILFIPLDMVQNMMQSCSQLLQKKEMECIIM